MKNKLLSIFFLVLFMIILVGCGDLKPSNPNEDQPDGPGTGEPGETPEDPENPDDPGVIELSYRFDGFEYKEEQNQDVYTKYVSNSEEFMIITDGISVESANTTMKVYEDIEKTIEVNYEEDVNLLEQDNIFYIVFENGNISETVKMNIYRLRIFTVHFETNTDRKLRDVEVEENSLVEKPDVELVKKGHKFNGWNYNFSKPVTSDLTIQAKWKVQSYTITYDPNEGEIAYGSTIVTFGDAYELDTPSREGFEFMGWEYEGKLIEDETWSIEGDITVVAKWEVVTKTFEIEYVIVGAVGPNLQRTYTNKEEVVLRTPYKCGYKFVGWYYEGDLSGERIYVIPKGTEGNLRLYSKWESFKLSGSEISFLGDSITTFYSSDSELNSSFTGKDEYYYPLYSSTVKKSSDTWWSKVLSATNTKLVVNNSLSGSSCYNNGSETSGKPAMNTSRINTLAGSDIIVIFIGTNDNVNGFSEEIFRKAYDTMIKRVKEVCPDSYVFCCTMGYSAYNKYYYTEERRLAFNDIIRDLVEDNDIAIIEFSEIQTKDNYSTLLGDALHPSAAGMTAYAEKAIETIKNYVGA